MDKKVYILGRDAVPSFIRLGKDEALELTLVALPGYSGALSLEVDLDERGASLDLAGAYLCTTGEELSFKILVKHNSPDCTSSQLFKGIVGGSARASFDGLIYVAPDAQQTKARQENHSILLSSEARVESRPQLEIYADDVECSHGATSGALNAEERFYMQSRGIPEEQALQLQKLAFLAPILSRIPEETAALVYDSLA